MVELTEVQRTIIEQLRTMNPFFMADYGVKQIITMPNAIRLHIGKAKVNNIDINYNSGSDLYDLEFHTLNRKTFDSTTEKVDDVYADQLDNVIRDKLNN